MTWWPEDPYQECDLGYSSGHAPQNMARAGRSPCYQGSPHRRLLRSVKNFQSFSVICRKPHVASSICLRATIFQNPEGSLWTFCIFTLVPWSRVTFRKKERRGEVCVLRLGVQHLQCYSRHRFVGLKPHAVVRIHIAVWVRTPCRLVHGYECLQEHSGSVFTGSQKMEAVCPDRNFVTHQSDYTITKQLNTYTY
jgi:hypothetical protein